MSFQQLISNPGILQAIEEAGYTTPTPIQAQAIPEILKGSDLSASAQTGTGKTAAFILPLLNLLATPSSVEGKGPRILILVPTRELAMQVAAEAAKYSKHLPKVKTVCIYGGAPYPLQNKELSRHYEILVATPGRLMDHMERGKINFSRLQAFVLDEADRMLDMGFIEDVEKIAESLPPKRQTLLFSATLKGSVLKLCKKLLRNPVEIAVAAEKARHDNIEQRLHNVDNIDHKYRILDHLLADPAMQQVIVFTSTKHHAEVLAEKLEKSGHLVDALHGDMKQKQRSRTIMQFRKGDFRILVATDVAARGIDVPAISHVINFDLPNNVEDYVHRIGRTGRAGSSGVALSFAASKDRQLIRRIEEFTGQRITSHVIPGIEPKQKQSAAPSGHSRGYDRDRQPGGRPFPKSNGDQPYRKKGKPKHFTGKKKPSFARKRAS